MIKNAELVFSVGTYNLSSFILVTWKPLQMQHQNFGFYKMVRALVSQHLSRKNQCEVPFLSVLNQSQLFQSLTAQLLAAVASWGEFQALQGHSTRCLKDVCKMFWWPVKCDLTPIWHKLFLFKFIFFPLWSRFKKPSFPVTGCRRWHEIYTSNYTKFRTLALHEIYMIL